MNDCVWSYIRACNGKACKCGNYINNMSDKGDEIISKHTKNITPTIDKIVGESCKKLKKEYNYREV